MQTVSEVPVVPLSDCRPPNPGVSEIWRKSLFVPALDASVVLIAKNASTWLSGNLRVRYGRDLEWMWVWELPRDKPIIALWRNPLDRFVSFFEYCRQRDWEYWQERGCVDMSGSFEDFVLSVCNQRDGDRNMHYRSQLGQCCTHDGVFLPTEIIRWDFRAICERLGFVRLVENRNATQRWSETYWNDDLLDIVTREYQKDFEVWNG